MTARVLAGLVVLNQALNGVLTGIGFVLLWLVPLSLSSLAFGSVLPGVLLTFATFGVIGVTVARRRVEREAMARRLLQLEAVALVLEAAQASPYMDIDDVVEDLRERLGAEEPAI